MQDSIKTGESSNLSITIDSGKWYAKKLEELTDGNRDPKIGRPQRPTLTLPICGWKKFPSQNIPDSFNKGHIHFYMYESARIIGQNGNDCDINYATSKPFDRAEQYISSEYITAVQDVSTKDCYFVKANIKSSFCDKYHFVHVTISKASGGVLDASCSCKASAMGRCSHVAALLKCIVDHVEQNGYELSACTSLPCKWNRPTHKRKKPQTLTKAEYPTKSRFIKDKATLAEFDPGPSKCERSDITKSNDLLRALPSNRRCGWSTLLTISYADYAPTPQREVELATLRDTFLYHLRMDIEHQYDELTLNRTCTSYLVPNTCDQTNSLVWSLKRSLAITASIAKQVANNTSETGYKNILESHLWGLKKIETAPMRYGKENETTARESYLGKMKGISRQN